MVPTTDLIPLPTPTPHLNLLKYLLWNLLRSLFCYLLHPYSEYTQAPTVVPTPELIQLPTSLPALNLILVPTMAPTPAPTLVHTLVSTQVPALVSILVPTPDPTLVLITKNVLSPGPIIVPYFYKFAHQAFSVITKYECLVR